MKIRPVILLEDTTRQTNRHTDIQTNARQNITFLVDVICNIENTIPLFADVSLKCCTRLRLIRNWCLIQLNDSRLLYRFLFRVACLRCLLTDKI